MKYRVTLGQIAHQSASVTVDADSADHAAELALPMEGDLEYSTDDRTFAGILAIDEAEPNEDQTRLLQADPFRQEAKQ